MLELFWNEAIHGTCAVLLLTVFAGLIYGVVLMMSSCAGGKKSDWKKGIISILVGMGAFVALIIIALTSSKLL